MRIGIVSPNPASSAGGVERYCHEVSNALTSLGHDVSVVAWPISPASRFDLLVTNGMLGGRAGGVPRVHVAHGCWVPHVIHGSLEATRRWRVKRAAEGALAEIRAGRGAYRVAVSASAAEEWSRWYRLPCHTVVPNPVDTDMFRPADRDEARRALGWSMGRPIALFIGRAEDRKCPRVAFGATQMAGWQLIHAGTGTIEGAVALGSIDGELLARTYAAADAMILPSRYEGCSLAILEALACGIPVVATRMGWMEELASRIPGYGQLLAEHDDVQGFADALCSVDASRAAVAEAGDYVRRNHDRSSFLAAWAHLLETVASDRGPG